MRYLGVDPGETTGLCYINTTGEQYSIEYQQVAGLGALYEEIVGMEFDVVICEDFDRRQKPGNITPIIKGIAIVELYVHFIAQAGIPIHLEMQSASYGKAFWDNGKLKRIGVYNSKMKHANDAARHVLQYLSNKGNDRRFIMMLKPEDFTA